MSKFFIGIIAGLAFCHFLPQAALALAIIAAIGLAVASQERRKGRRRKPLQSKKERIIYANHRKHPR